MRLRADQRTLHSALQLGGVESDVPDSHFAQQAAEMRLWARARHKRAKRQRSLAADIERFSSVVGSEYFDGDTIDVHFDTFAATHDRDVMPRAIRDICQCT